MEKLFIWYMDCGWSGSITVIAKTLEEARNLMKNEPNYDSFFEIEKFPIREGMIITNLGDS